MIELLKYFGNKNESSRALMDIEIKLMKCLGLMLRNDKISKQFLTISENTSKGLEYIIDLAQEYHGMLGDVDNIMQDSLSREINLLLNSLIVIRQLIIGSQRDVLNQYKLLPTFINTIFEMLLRQLTKAS